MPREESAYLLDILIAARQIGKFTSNLTKEEFNDSDLHQLAVTRDIEIIGEAAGKISSQFRADNPQIPWQDIIGMRNRLIHEYFEIDLQEVWKTAQTDIPKSIAQIEQLVPPEERL